MRHDQYVLLLRIQAQPLHKLAAVQFLLVLKRPAVDCPAGTPFKLRFQDRIRILSPAFSFLQQRVDLPPPHTVPADHAAVRSKGQLLFIFCAHIPHRCIIAVKE